MPCVRWSIGGDEYGFDAVILHQFFERGISLLAAASFGETVTAVGHEIAHGDNLDIRMVLKSKVCSELAEPVTNDAEANLPIRN